jgi:hypothetical protein
MKHFILFSFLIVFLAAGSSAQKMIGYGGELSVLSFKPNARLWISKNTGFEVFGGIASEMDNFKLNDAEAGFKFLKTIIYKRSERTYWGIMGKWKWVDVTDPNISTSLPVPGILIGKEWYSKRINRKGFAVELGYQYGHKEYTIYSPIGHIPLPTKELFDEFPLILNLRYSFYQIRN